MSPAALMTTRLSSHTRPRFPAEWEPQSGVLLAWPHDESDWRSQLHTVEPSYVAIASAIARFEPVLILCRDEGVRARAQSACRMGGIDEARLRLFVLPYDDTWIRDTGPLSVCRGGQPQILDFGFNAWGGRYAHAQDAELVSGLHRLGLFGQAPARKFPLVLEGGSIETDGMGSLLTTRSCLLSPNRNPHLDQAAIEAVLQEALGIDRILWLSGGCIEGDDTDGHVDTLARFCNAETIAFSTCRDRADVHWEALQQLESELKPLRTRGGKLYRLIPLPLPSPVFDDEGKRLPANYANFLILNGAVLIPQYADAADAIALERLRRAFPDRELVPVDCRALVTQYGSLHCMSMQLASGVLA
jgi:agmatine/peptidylarginine deiminase